MADNKLKIGQKGGAKRLTEMVKKIREAPLSKEFFRILEEGSRTKKEKPRKIANPKIDLEG